MENQITNQITNQVANIELADKWRYNIRIATKISAKSKRAAKRFSYFCVSLKLIANKALRAS